MLFSFEGGTSWLLPGIHELLALSLFWINSPVKRYIRVRSQTKELCPHGAWGAAWWAHRSIPGPQCGRCPKKGPTSGPLHILTSHLSSRYLHSCLITEVTSSVGPEGTTRFTCPNNYYLFQHLPFLSSLHIPASEIIPFLSLFKMF